MTLAATEQNIQIKWVEGPDSGTITDWYSEQDRQRELNGQIQLTISISDALGVLGYPAFLDSVDTVWGTGRDKRPRPVLGYHNPSDSVDVELNVVINELFELFRRHTEPVRMGEESNIHLQRLHPLAGQNFLFNSAFSSIHHGRIFMHSKAL